MNLKQILKQRLLEQVSPELSTQFQELKKKIPTIAGAALMLTSFINTPQAQAAETQQPDSAWPTPDVPKKLSDKQMFENAIRKDLSTNSPKNLHAIGQSPNAPNGMIIYDTENKDKYITLKADAYNVLHGTLSPAAYDSLFTIA